jgi:GTPase
VKFVDSCKFVIRAGPGGKGAVAFRREKFVPFGGPSGGDGGRGGDVIFIGDPGKNTLLDLTYARAIEAEKGENGLGKDCYGRAGKSREVRVPVGTQVFSEETGELLYDIAVPNEPVIVARGGKGGRGNMHFATPFDRAPRRAEPGELGEEKAVRLELKVMADVGLLGYPNVGKSTFISAVSRARAKVADYPFTTLIPQLGVAAVDADRNVVIADIPGLIEGAAQGAGLGLRFLKHVERTRALLHIVSLDFGEGRDPVTDYKKLLHELREYDSELAQRPTIVVVSKGDLPDVQTAYPDLERRFAKLGIRTRLISAATGLGTRETLEALYRTVHGLPHPAGEEPTFEVAAKSPTKKVAAKKAAAKKPLAKKTAVKKTAAKKNAVKKSLAKKPVAKKVTKKVVAKETTATKKSVAKKKVASKKMVAKKTASKKAQATRPVAKKALTKRAARKNAHAKKRSAQQPR